MKKTLMMKILSGAVFAAIIVAGTVNSATAGAGIHVAAGSNAFIAEADDEGLAVESDALTVPKIEEAAIENEAAAEDKNAAKEETEAAETAEAAVDEGSAAAAAAAELAETDDAKAAEDAGDAEAVPSIQTAQNVQQNPPQAVQNTQQAQQINVVTEDEEENQVYTATSESVIRIEFPPEEETGDEEENQVYTATSKYTITVEFPPEEETEPVYVEVPFYSCNCGFETFDYDELKQHMFQHALNGDRNSYHTGMVKVQQ